MSRKHPFKKYQTTIIMAALAAGLGGFAWFEFQQAKIEEVQEQKAEMILGWEDVSQIQSVRLEKDKEVIEVTRDGELWRMMSPVKDLGDSFNIEAWVKDIGTEKGRKIEAKKDSHGEIAWKEYGLDKNLQSLSIAKVSGESALIQFADHNAFDGSYFFKFNNEVWIGEKTWVSILTKSSKSLRERDVYRHELSPHTMSFNYKSGSIKDDFTVKLKESKQWEIVGKEWLVSDADVGEWFQALRKISAVDFLDHLSEKNLRDYNLHQPLAELKFEIGESESETWKISSHSKKKGEEKFYIQINDSSTIFEVDKAFVEKVLASQEFFRDGKPPFKFPLENLTSLTYSDKTHKQVELSRADSGQWILKSNVKGYEFSEEQLQNYLQKLQSLEAQLFLSKKELKGLTHPQLQLSLKLKGIENPVEIVFGEEFTSAKVFTHLNPVIYTLVKGVDAVAVHKTAVNQLMLSHLLKKSEVQPSANESGQN